MIGLLTSTGTSLLGINRVQENILAKPIQFTEYAVIFVSEGEGTFYSDFGSFPFQGPVLLFATPLQMIYIQEKSKVQYTLLQFHGDFYCIEYHREEVACNGLLFNNIYISPFIKLTAADYSSFNMLIDQIEQELCVSVPSDIVLKSYLQLFLAKSSQVKRRELVEGSVHTIRDEQMELFKQMLEENFLTLRKPNDYATLLSMPPNTFTKRCTKYFRKTPSQLIIERLILEAKKQLHLTRKSIKEIAYTLNFEDEFYFSRVFKKYTNESPQSFRDKTGISIVADLHR
ncbi:AraC family transcriptional regulator [Cytophagaceae bacterium DM2B3-1]|uniref:AraC family transcriptional regulator n=1 Tax=Xanthocytophaga flava TaxID=3048013 RepID=A0ABT7CYT0_9BACT|nr:AraC family transcriptional regulator [Xanthocytophaga flavus]MDJ1470157.1 AraC family transcriptional regulator [Xanthocytophaga flavus]MDJ1498931.1 AraC family transcriptional regulator [Xanthocytophaga flavus]